MVTSPSSGRSALGDLRRSKPYQVLVTTGLVSYGLVHVVLAWIALQIAFGSGREASGQGALRTLARQPLGTALMWAMTIGLLTLVVWQVLEATVGRDEPGRDGALRRRLSSAGRAVVYLVLGLSAGAIAIGAGRQSGDPGRTATARLMSLPAGRILVAAVGAAIIGIGVAQIVKGVKKKFTEDLREGASRPVQTLGTFGYVAKGVAVCVIGLLFGYAALTHDPKRAGNLDTALATIRDQSLGPVLLVVIAAGIAAFGLFCFAWAKSARH